MDAIKGTLTPIRDKVIVSDMEFGEQTTAGGIIIAADDGNVRGIYPRWGKIYAKGSENDDDYQVNDWILVEHGRWTRGIELQDPNTNEEKTIRMVETESILGWSKDKPNDVRMSESSSGDWNPDSIDPGGFVDTAMNNQK